jgi:hypothetical protein
VLLPAEKPNIAKSGLKGCGAPLPSSERMLEGQAAPKPKWPDGSDAVRPFLDQVSMR